MITKEKINICNLCSGGFLDGEEHICRPKIDIEVEEPEDGIGIFTHTTGYAFPYKGFPDGKHVEKANIIKRVTFSTLKFITLKPQRYLLPLFLFLPKKTKLKVIRHVFRWFKEIVLAAYVNPAGGDFFLNPKTRYCQSGRELWRTGNIIIDKYIPANKDDFDLERRNMRIVLEGLLQEWEFDNSYRYPGQDLFGELNKEEFNKNPRKELLRVIDIGIERECHSNEDETGNSRMVKIKLLRKLIKYGLLYRPLKHLIVDFINELNLDEMKLDDWDYYWCLDRWDWNFRGKPFSERINKRREIDKIVPVRREKGNPAQIGFLPNEEFYKLPTFQAKAMVDELVKNFFSDFEKMKQ